MNSIKEIISPFKNLILENACDSKLQRSPNKIMSKYIVLPNPDNQGVL
jgi:hypothetical protein